MDKTVQRDIMRLVVRGSLELLLHENADMIDLFEEAKRFIVSAAGKAEKLGRRPTTKDDIPAVFYKHYPSYMSGTLNVSELARICGLSRPTVYKYLRITK